MDEEKEVLWNYIGKGAKGTNCSGFQTSEAGSRLLVQTPVSNTGASMEDYYYYFNLRYPAAFITIIIVSILMIILSS